MKNEINIAVIGLGQIGIYLYNELQKKKKIIELKTGKKIKIVGIGSIYNKLKKINKIIINFSCKVINGKIIPSEILAVSPKKLLINSLEFFVR